MDDISENTVTVTGSLTRDEYDEAVKAAGLFRRGRVVVVLGTVLLAASGVSLSAHGGTLHAVPLCIAAVYALLGLVVLPRLLAARGFRRGRCAEEKRTTVDEAGVTVTRGGETTRVAWDEIRWYHETPRLHVFVGRSGGRTCLLVMPKRLFAGPAESERFGVIAHAQAGDGH
ncbi:YcxB family protein [Streptomyces sp. NPDC096339]|uniref:YcxB family protein n=1 Tax=Streptomyces sp. NPDC096339 TaxID=3366086 RepID=UPI0037FF8996